jgi:hypothetical protein
MFGLFKTKAKPTHPSSKEAEPERYAGKPLLVLLENFVLHSIGELPPDKNGGQCSPCSPSPGPR